MYYSEDVVEQVRTSTNIVDVIGNYVQLRKKGNSYFGLCPFHNEKTGSFSVSQDKQMFYCFGCGKGGSVFTFLMEYENYTYPEAIEYLANQAGIELPKQELTIEQKKLADDRAILREMNKDAANYFYRMLRHEHGKRGYEYFKSRQISDEVIKRFGLGFADTYRDDLYQYLCHKGYTDSQLRDSGLVEIEKQGGGHDKFWNRVMFPIVDMNGKVIGFGGRVMGEGEPKYLNSKETVLFEKKRNLYGLHLARKSKREGFILCEGYMDVISMHQAGFDNAVASLGTAFTEEQARLLKRFRNHVYLAYDNDGAGQKAALRAITICRTVELSARVISMKPYKDPDEFIKNLGADEFEQRLKHSDSSMMFEIRIISGNYNLNDPEGKTDFGKEAAAKLALIQDKLERENYVRAVAEQYGFQYETFLEQVNQIGEQEYKKQHFKEVEQQDKLSHQKELSKTRTAYQLPEKLLLTWASNYPTLWGKLLQYITPEEFSSELTKEIARQFTQQYEKMGRTNPVELLDSIADIEKHAEVSAIVNEPIYYNEDEDMEEEERGELADKAVTEALRRMKEISIERRMKELASLPADNPDRKFNFTELLKEQQSINNLYITLDNG